MGWRLTTFWVTGVLLNTCLKYLIRAPRPWWVNSDLAPLHPHPAGGFGMPSGHTQSAVGILLGLWCLGRVLRTRNASKEKSPSSFHLWLTSLGILWVIGIAVTRVSLHAHSLPQVFVGGILGLAWAMFILWTERSTWGLRALISFSVLFTLLGLWLTSYTPEFPSEWTKVILAHQVTPPSSPSLAKILTTGGLSVVWAGLLRLKQE